jgi:hypothetical protein
MTPLEIIIERANAGIETHQRFIDNENSNNIEKNRHTHLKSVCEMFKSLALENLTIESKFVSKSIKWDKLHDKIAKCYFDEDGEELSKDESEDIDLGTIGEISAIAFGFL